MPHLVHIGNSLGVRIPKTIIEQLGFKEKMNLVFKITEEGLLISLGNPPRHGWEQKFKSSTKEPKKSSLLGSFPNDFDKHEWEW